MKLAKLIIITTVLSNSAFADNNSLSITDKCMPRAEEKCKCYRDLSDYLTDKLKKGDYNNHELEGLKKYQRYYLEKKQECN